MVSLLKSLVIPPLEYCSQLSDVLAVKAIQRTFTYKITELQHLNYWERLHKLKLYSLQRRRNRYMLIYLWKITQHMVPTIDGCVLDEYSTIRNSAQSLQENAITVFGPRLYNSLPGYQRHRKCQNWKIQIRAWKLFGALSGWAQKCPTMSPRQEATTSLINSHIVGLNTSTTPMESPTQRWSRLNCSETTPSNLRVN